MTRGALLLAVAVAVLVAGRADALDRWTWQDTAWEAGFAALVLVDVGQTRWAMQNGWEEGNPLLGKHPTDTQLNTLAVAVPLAHAAVSTLLPAGPWRRGWQVFTVGVEAHAVYRSYSIGVKVAF